MESSTGLPPGISATQRALTVIVVGAGVSGCACAAALALAGAKVTLMNSAMDRVGLPAYGPDVIEGSGSWSALHAWLDSLPEPIRAVWLQAATKPASGEPLLNIDRRRVSIESKRVLEEIPGLQFRQGFVTDLRVTNDDMPVPAGPAADESMRHATDVPAGRAGDTRREPAADAQSEEGADAQTKKSPDGVERCLWTSRVQVETAFGEVFEADAAVIAVGLSLGSTMASGNDVTRGGRYGEPSSEGLRQALIGLGAALKDATLEVGPRVHLRTAISQGWLNRGADSLRGTDGWACVGPGWLLNDRDGVSEEVLVPAGGENFDRYPWPPGHPPAPHRRPDLRFDCAVMTQVATGGGPAAQRPTLSPDGSATLEMYATPGGLVAGELAAVTMDVSRPGPIASRESLVVTGTIVDGLEPNGRVLVGRGRLPVWVVGRAAGAADYVASLTSGVRAAADIAAPVGGGQVAPGCGRGRAE